jgi:hypothetical protein
MQDCYSFSLGLVTESYHSQTYNIPVMILNFRGGHKGTKHVANHSRNSASKAAAALSLAKRTLKPSLADDAPRALMAKRALSISRSSIFGFSAARPALLMTSVL